MANNRMWLMCKVCRGALFLAKTMNAGWYFGGDAEAYGNRVEKFLDDHDQCSFEDEDQEIFELVYEVSGKFQYHYETNPETGYEEVTKLVPEQSRHALIGWDETSEFTPEQLEYLLDKRSREKEEGE